MDVKSLLAPECPTKFRSHLGPDVPKALMQPLANSYPTEQFQDHPSPAMSASTHLSSSVGSEWLPGNPPGEETAIPLDCHSASKEADEKRRRNAVASQRFRHRRKARHKDREEEVAALKMENASQQATIKRLEGEIRRLEEIIDRSYHLSACGNNSAV